MNRKKNSLRIVDFLLIWYVVYLREQEVGIACPYRIVFINDRARLVWLRSKEPNGKLVYAELPPPHAAIASSRRADAVTIRIWSL